MSAGVSKDDPENDADDILYGTASGTVLHVRRGCPSIRGSTTRIRAYARDRAPDRPICKHCESGEIDTSNHGANARSIHCPYCGELVSSGDALRVHVRDDHPDE